MNSDDDFEKRLRADLGRLVGDTPPRIRERLDRMATTAARDARDLPSASRLRWMLPLGGAVVACVAVAVLAVRNTATPPAPAAPVATATAGPSDDFALLLNVDNLELLEQMEFYQWLDRDPGLLEGEGDAASAAPQRS